MDKLTLPALLLGAAVLVPVGLALSQEVPVRTSWQAVVLLSSLAHETANMVLNAEMKLRASLLRTESRGSHYREDFPDRDDELWRAWIVIRRGADGQRELERVPVATG